MSAAVGVSLFLVLLAVSTPLASGGADRVDAGTPATCDRGFFTLIESIPEDVNLTTNVTTTEAWLQMINGAQSTLEFAVFYMTLTGGDPEGQLVYNAMVRNKASTIIFLVFFVLLSFIHVDI